MKSSSELDGDRNQALIHKAKEVDEADAGLILDSWEDAEDINQTLSRLSISPSTAVPATPAKDATRDENETAVRSTRGTLYNTPSSSSVFKPTSLTPVDLKDRTPVLSRHGVNLGDMRAFVHDLPAEDILGHGLYMSGFPTSSSSLPPNERQLLVTPWLEAGAIISWLPDNASAVAMFCSIPTANRALRQLRGGAIKARSLKDCPPAIQREAQGAGLIIPPRPTADTSVSSRLIRGALGIKPQGSSAGDSSKIRTSSNGAAVKMDERNGADEEGGSGGDAWDT